MIHGLTGVRVVDVTTSVAGPFATQILADLGADVVKVERAQGGDDTRAWGPPFWGNGEGVSFTSLNRNKRSIALDLAEQPDRQVLERLVEQADVLVQNMRPGRFAAMGYTWERLKEMNRRLVYCEITGFGHAGPKSADAAYDPLMQAYSGLMSITGEEGRPPVRIPVSILDKGTGMWTAIGVLNALRLRDLSGCGSHLQMSLLDTALTWEASQLTGYIASGQLPTRAGSGIQGIAPYHAFGAQDGHLIVAAGNQRLWEALCAALGRQHLAADPRFATNVLRVQNLQPLLDLLADIFKTATVAEWVERLTAARVPVTPIRTMDDVVGDPQVAELGTLHRTPRLNAPEYTLVNLPIVADGQRFGLRMLPPGLGEHSDAVRAEAFVDDPAGLEKTV